MVSIFGMNDVGNVFYDMQNQNSFSKPFSEETAMMIDVEARKMLKISTSQQLLREKESS